LSEIALRLKKVWWWHWTFTRNSSGNEIANVNFI